MTATEGDGRHPRPQLQRERYRLLDGVSGFAFDDDEHGMTERWFSSADPFTREIVLPFSPESAASGIGDTRYHRVAWYRREITADDLAAAGLGKQGSRVVLHVGAVDSAARVWVDGAFVGEHRGGQTPFGFDITDALLPGLDTHAIVLRAEDDPQDTTLPRGKQDWHERPHSIWYHRITGIWRSLWLEVVPELHIASVAWNPDVAGARLACELEFSAPPPPGATVEIVATMGSTRLGRLVADADGTRVALDLALPSLRNGQAVEEFQWSPDAPRLVDLRVTLIDGTAAEIDAVDSYTGLRTVEVRGGHLMLNDRPFYLRSVLQQGYWPQSHYTPPSVEAMREEIELIKRLGFNSIRIHQKVEDPRYLYWCDRLGLTVWAEAASAYEFSPRAIELFTADWVRIVRGQRSHPSVIAWVPFNESWGIQHVASDPAQQAYSLALTHLTRALDPSRPVISNDGWEHTGSDIITLHDYESSGSVLEARYGSAEGLRSVAEGFGPHGRRSMVTEHEQQLPVMLTEFGGVRFAANASGDAWGYSSEETAEAFEQRLRSILGAVTGSPAIAGFCYTQLTDTGQEMNGLCDAHRVAKLPEATIRAIVTGS